MSNVTLPQLPAPVAEVPYHDICADHEGTVLAYDYLPQGTKLYLAPQPVVPRLPLTDEEIDKLLFESGATRTSVHLDDLVCGYVVEPPMFDAIIRAVERLHGIREES